jgi:hypothetical protein
MPYKNNSSLPANETNGICEVTKSKELLQMEKRQETRMN